MEAIFHLTPNISYPLMIVVSALMLPVMIVRFYMGWLQMVLLDLPLIVASFWSITRSTCSPIGAIPEKLEAWLRDRTGSHGRRRCVDHQ
jgi:hypothetical protein